MDILTIATGIFIGQLTWAIGKKAFERYRAKRRREWYVKAGQIIGQAGNEDPNAYRSLGQ